MCMISLNAQTCGKMMQMQKNYANIGDVVTVQMNLEPENDFVPENLFDRSGAIQFIVGWGNYLPGIHELVQKLQVNESIHNISIDAGYGAHLPDLIVPVSRTKLSNNVKVGDTINLPSIHRTAHVVKITNDTVTIDANVPLAGASYQCDLTLESIQDRSDFTTAVFALGCFWGAELLFMRIKGVVGTRVGYTQGTTDFPTYEQVCGGTTQHREAVQVVFDPSVVSYSELVQSAIVWLKELQTPQDLHDLFSEQDPQYRSGIYYEDSEQQKIARRSIDVCKTLSIELLPVARFWVAEDGHQQYLYKGGQSGRKGDKTPIRCFG